VKKFQSDFFTFVYSIKNEPKRTMTYMLIYNYIRIVKKERRWRMGRWRCGRWRIPPPAIDIT
jgi:hypothetical protein